MTVNDKKLKKKKRLKRKEERQTYKYGSEHQRRGMGRIVIVKKTGYPVFTIRQDIQIKWLDIS